MEKANVKTAPLCPILFSSEFSQIGIYINRIFRGCRVEKGAFHKEIGQDEMEHGLKTFPEPSVLQL